MNTRVKRWLLHYAVAAILFAVIDALWIINVARPQYENYIGHLTASELNLAGATAFYLIYVAGIVHYGIQPNNKEVSLTKRLASAALFGLFTYATWALTALTILKDFPTSIAITDILWGACVSSLVTWLVILLSRRLYMKKLKQ